MYGVYEIIQPTQAQCDFSQQRKTNMCMCLVYSVSCNQRPSLGLDALELLTTKPAAKCYVLDMQLCTDAINLYVSKALIPVLFFTNSTDK